MATVTSVIETTRNWAEQRQIFAQTFATTTSTNELAKQNANSETSALALYVADHQTAGRGRGKNSWLDTGAGESLLSSWSWSVTSAPQAITAPRIGLAVFRALKEVWPSLPWSVKEPNDIYLGKNKTAGLLIEAVSQNEQTRLIVGLGLNVLNHPRSFPAAEHLAQALNGPVDEGDWFQFLDSLKREMLQAMQDVIRPQLAPAICGELKTALNSWPAREEPLQAVSPEGDLIFKSGKVPWTNL